MHSIKLSSFDHRYLDNFVLQLTEKALRYGYHISGPFPIPVRMKRWTLLASPQAHKDARVQLEMRRSCRLIKMFGEGLKPLPVVLAELSRDSRVEVLIS